MMQQYAIYTSSTGRLYADYSSRAQGVTMTTNERGYAECRAFVPMDLPEMLILYDYPALLHVVVRDDATGRAFEGRLEDIKIEDGGISLGAFGYARAMADVPYSAFWSSSQVSDWQQIANGNYSLANADMYNHDQSAGRLYLSLKKGAIYRSVNDLGGWYIVVPSGSSRNIVGVSFDISWNLPASWTISYGTAADALFTGASGVATLTTAGGTDTRTLHSTFGGAAVFFLNFYNSSGVSLTNTLEDWAYFVEITNLRVVSDTTNRISTTTTAAVSAGASKNIPVVSSAGMYVGQQLQLNATGGAGAGETLIVTAVPDATHVTVASVAATYGASGVTVKAHRVLADAIARDMLSSVNAVNPTQIASDTGLIQSPGVDLLDVTYLDAYPADVLDRLIVLGDTFGRIWEWGVLDDRVLYFRPQYDQARAWYTDTRQLDIDRTLDNLFNSVYAVYQDVNGDEVRSAASSDTSSIAQYGLTRRVSLGTRTTNATEAGVQVTAALADSATIQPRSGMTITALYDAFGNAHPLTDARTGDTMTIRNLPPNISPTIDRVRTFRISRAEFDADANTLTVEPGAPLPLLEVLLARLAKEIV